MGTSASKDKAVATRRVFALTSQLPAPYQLAIEDTPFQLTILEHHGACDHDGDALMPGTWFSVELRASTEKRYLYLVQKESDTGIVVLLMLFDRAAAEGRRGIVDEAHGVRLPSSGAWMRAVVDGEVYVLASDLVLTRKSITAWIGGHEPPTIPAKPPYA